MLAGALTQARTPACTILDVMDEAIDAPDEMSPYAPRIITVKIPVDKIGEVIGPKGKMINRSRTRPAPTISIEDDGTIYIGATDGPSAEAAPAAINAIANPQMPEIGERFLGTVVKTTDLRRVRLAAARARTACCTSRELRKLAGGKRVENVEDVRRRRPEDPGRDRRDRRPRQALARPGRRRGRGRGRGRGRAR